MPAVPRTAGAPARPMACTVMPQSRASSAASRGVRVPVLLSPSVSSTITLLLISYLPPSSSPPAASCSSARCSRAAASASASPMAVPSTARSVTSSMLRRKPSAASWARVRGSTVSA